MIKISVIIPVKNMAEFLGRAIDSVLNQSLPVQEIIVADDASTDNSVEVAQSRGVKIIQNTGPCWGICGGRNAAFAASAGDFILPLDADDWIAPTYIEETTKLMTPEVGIVSTYFMYHGKNEGTILVGPEQTYESELQSNNITVCSLVRRECIEKAGPWDHNLRGWEDWDMWLRILKLGWQHAVVKKVLFHYRLHDTGMNTWANQPENKAKLYGYLAAKHPGFAELRKTGRKWNGI
jgi:glycosyltransferase involved in cell wall biosynthesis